jgi:ribose transport system substrate-binding protein
MNIGRTKLRGSTVTVISVSFVAIAGLLVSPIATAAQQAGLCGKGITKKVALKDMAPFVASNKVGKKPNLPKTIAWANTSNAEFFLQITDAMKKSATSRGLKFITAIANDNSDKNIQQIESFLQKGIGALAIQPLDVNAQAPLLQRAIDKGIAVETLVTPPSTNQAIADQYKVGYTQGLAAAKYITAKLGGKAKVAYFNWDKVEVLKARHQGVLDGVKTAGAGVEIVADIEPPALTNDAGFQATSTLLQAHPDVNVILGGDTIVLGSLAAIKAAGITNPDIYLSGVDGDQQAIAEVAKGGIYHASFAFAYPLMGYAWGQFAADWLEGKAIPQVMSFNAIPLDSAAAIAKWNAAMKDPAKSWKSAKTYFTMLGSVH